MKLVGAWVAVILLLMGASCRSKQKSLLKKEMVTYQQQTSESHTLDRALSVEHFGDTLWGRVPLPFSSPVAPGATPLIIPVSSSGINLELTVDSEGITYRAIAKPMAKMTVQETETQTSKSGTSEAVVKEVIKNKEVKQEVPWWLILIGILLVLILVAWRILKNHFNPL